jgi:hypothetical protein
MRPESQHKGGIIRSFASAIASEMRNAVLADDDFSQNPL